MGRSHGDAAGQTAEVQLTELVRYNAMRRAIAECHSIDEVKEIRDKAIAFQHYCRQSEDFEGERQCAEIRSRASKQAGILWSEMAKARGTQGKGRPSLGGSENNPPKDDQPATLADLGISKNTAHEFRQMARVPEETIAEAVADTSVKPTPANIIARHKAKERAKGRADPPPPAAPPGHLQATYGIGHIRTLAEYCREHDAEFVAGAVCDYDLDELLPNIEAAMVWLKQFSTTLDRNWKQQ